MAKNLEGLLIKKANTIQTYTKYEQSEFAKCLDPKDGYLHFITNYYYVQSYTGKCLFKPYDYQIKLLESFHNYDKVVALQPRQSGKCVTRQTGLKIRNKKTGIEEEFTIGDFYELIKNISS